jgi:hypothetical protein
MAEPIEPIEEVNTNTNNIPDRLKSVLDALSEYHKDILIKYSHFTQSPQELIAIQTLLREKAKVIRNYLLYNKFPEGADPELKECLDHLKKANTPWDPEISTLTNYWCDLMFIKHPFTMSHAHIKNLLKNSLAIIEDDTNPPESDDV